MFALSPYVGGLSKSVLLFTGCATINLQVVLVERQDRHHPAVLELETQLQCQALLAQAEPLGSLLQPLLPVGPVLSVVYVLQLRTKADLFQGPDESNMQDHQVGMDPLGQQLVTE
jgi:hypothetical protein